MPRGRIAAVRSWEPSHSPEAYLARTREGNTRRVLSLFSRSRRAVIADYDAVRKVMCLRRPLWSPGRGAPRRLTRELRRAAFSQIIQSVNACLSDQLLRFRLRYHREGTTVRLRLEVQPPRTGQRPVLFLLLSS